MKVSLVLSTAAASLLLTQAITLNENAAPRVISLNIKKNDYTPQQQVETSYAQFGKRRTINEILNNKVTYYSANITLGTPAQHLSLQIDTGSSDLWANTPNSTLCSNSSNDCFGTYNSTKSSTYTYINSDFNITYNDDSAAAGDYVTDKLTIGGSTLLDFEFGVGYTSTSDQGVMGIGYEKNEASIENDGITYTNFPVAMTNAGFINTPAYSLWLNDLESSEGSILFGGVNTDKYTGELESIPILEDEKGEYTQFLVTLTRVDYTSSLSGSVTSINSSLPVEVLLDSGASLSYLPDEMVGDLYNAFGAVYMEELEGLEVYTGVLACSDSIVDSGAYINYTFSSPSIQVNLSEFISPIIDTQGNTVSLTDGSQACALGISPAGNSFASLGDNFLRSAYVVYDLDSNEISLAQTNFNSTTDNIKEITSGPSGVPGASNITTAVTAVSVHTGTTQDHPSATSVVETNTLTAPVNTTSTAPATTTSTAPTTTTSTAPATTNSTIPATTNSTIPATTNSTIPATTNSTAPATTTSTAPAMATYTGGAAGLARPSKQVAIDLLAAGAVLVVAAL